MSTAATRSLVVVSAGLGQPSSTRLLADRLSTAAHRHLREAGIEPRIEVIELRDQAKDLVNNFLAGFPSPGLQAALDAVLAADGLIVATPIFSASYSGLFKLFFDLRPLFAYLNAAVAPTAVYAATEDWGVAVWAPTAASSSGSIGRPWSSPLRCPRAPAAPKDPFADPVPFDQLLGS